jgi:hypothetical protein
MPKTRTVRTVRPDTPPPKRTLRWDWTQIAATLRAAPGEWHLIFEGGPASTAAALKRGKMSAIRPSEFEFRTANHTRHANPRTCDLWLRFVGDPEQRESRDAAASDR